ncbi:MAG: HD domain-containing phosphohydrolase [Anaerolineae bacterium]
MTDDHLTLLTAKEAAAYLRISLFTLNRMEKDGHVIPFRTPGGHRRYSLSMLNDYLRGSRSVPRLSPDGAAPAAHPDGHAARHIAEPHRPAPAATGAASLPTGERDGVLDAYLARPRPTEATITPLVDLGRTLASAMSLGETLNSILDLVQRAFWPISSEAVVFDEGLDSDVIVALRGQPPEALGYPRPERAEVRRLACQTPTWLLRDLATPSCAEPATSGHAVTVPLMFGTEAVGALTLVRDEQSQPYQRGEAQLLQIFGYQIGTGMIHARTHQRLLESFRNLKEATLSTVQTLFAAIETYDKDTHDHSERVSVYAHQLGARIGMQGEALELLRIAGLLHDIGKLGIGDETLRKSASLTPAELDRVKLHPVWGARILGGLDAFAQIIPWVRHHHEHYDGAGYPDHLAGDAIPLGARIIAVVDAFDSMTSDRPYRPAQPTPRALANLLRGGNSQWDAWLVREWSNLVDEGTAALEQPLASLYAGRPLESEI